MLTKRKALSASERADAAQKLAQSLRSWVKEQYQHSMKVIAGYVACNGELDVMPAMVTLANHNNILALPCVESGSKRLTFRRWQSGDALRIGAYDIQEPLPEQPMVQPTLLLVPLVAADESCQRMGYGGGYYDQTIASLKKNNPKLVTIGIAYDLQVVGAIPTEEHDMALDAIWTPTRKIGR